MKSLKNKKVSLTRNVVLFINFELSTRIFFKLNYFKEKQKELAYILNL